MVIRFLLMNAFAVGGTIRTTFATAGALADRGHDVEVVSVLRHRADRQLPLDLRVRLRVLADLRPAALSGPGRRWAAERPSRLIHAGDVRVERFNLLSDAALLRYLASVSGGVLIGTRPGLNLAIARYARRGVVTVGQDHLNLDAYAPELVDAIREHYGRLDALAALTEGTAAKYRALLGPQNAGRVVVVPNAAPPPRPAPAALERPVVTAAGIMTARKGFDRLLRAWALVAPDRPQWRLDIFGEGHGRPGLERLTERLGLAASVRWRGHSNRLIDEVADSSLFAMTSRLEGFPMVVLEAMSAGVPVVAYDCPTGPRDIITDGVDGRVVANGRTRLLAEALAELMDDAGRRRALGAAALETAGRYGMDAIAAHWEELLAELAARR